MEGFSEEQSLSRILWGRVGVSQAEAGKEEAEAEARQQESEVGLRVAGMSSSGWDVRAVSSQAFSGFLPLDFRRIGLIDHHSDWDDEYPGAGTKWSLPCLVVGTQGLHL